tara:strand:- start:349 stop:807 length:459 start_codon:yes stop_codon:yes gene_type:complete
MKTKFLIIVLSIFFLENCDYKPVFSSQNIDLKFNSIEYDNSKINRILGRSIKSLSKNDSSNIYDVKIKTIESERIVTKDKKGNAEIYELKLVLEITFINTEKQKEHKKTIIEQITYKNNDNKFELKQYKNQLLDQMIQKMLQDILKFITLIK